MDFKEIFKSSKFETKSLDKFSDSVLLPKNQLLHCSSAGSLKLYDKQFEIIKTVEFKDKKIQPVGIAYDDVSSRIYFSDVLNHQIIMTTIDLDFIKTFGSKGSDSQTIDKPLGVCFKNNKLYICDFNNRRIQILDANLEFYDTLKLDYYPTTIKVSNNTIGICGNTGTYFYDIETKMPKFQHSGVVGRMNEIDSHFYVFSYSPKKMFCVYDVNGCLTDEISCEKISSSIASSDDGHILVMDDDLMITSQSTGQILKFKLVN